MIYQIPYTVDSSAPCLVETDLGSSQIFPSRTTALAFVRANVAALTKRGQTVLIAIQGADQRWRLFNQDLSPVETVTGEAAITRPTAIFSSL